MTRKRFWIQTAAFLAVGFLAPITYLIIRYNLFHPKTTYYVGFWGIVVLAIMLFMVAMLIKFYLDAMKTKWNIFKQIIQGFSAVILPLGLLLAVVVWLGDNINLIRESLMVMIPCAAVAIVINPLPKWVFDNNIEGIGDIFDSIFKRIKKGE